MTIILEKEYDRDLGLDYKEIADKVINYSLDYEKCPYEAEISLTLTDNDGIHQVNNEFRGIDRPTDVLSFPQFEDLEELPEEGEVCIGDVVICPEQALLQADDFGHSPERELLYLFVHSVFHLLGYDHMEEDEKSEMRAKEEAIMSKIGVER